MFSQLVYLNSNNGNGLIGYGDGEVYRHESGDLNDLENFIQQHKGKYIFTALSYDLKNEIEPLSSTNVNGSLFPNALLFAPSKVVKVQDHQYEVVQGGIDANELQQLKEYMQLSLPNQSLKLKERTSKVAYLNHVKGLLDELQYGNIYEINYCQEFYHEESAVTSPISLYNKVNEATKTPFSCFIELDEFVLISGSPERYIQKKGSTLLSQPIKGTIKRGLNEAEDLLLKEQLYNDPKERSENVMIVDLVRNDLSKIADKNSVQVDELFGIYSFETVHQMISTISCTINEKVSFTDILRATFPMGSMTGAPKLSAMKLIEQHEDFKRGLYAGSIGYIEPNGDFDLNVVIRSVVHNTSNGYTSCAVGGAITIQSDPEKEYQECQTKIQKILSVLSGQD